MTYHTINAQRRFFDSVCCKGYDVILLFEKILGNKKVFQYADISKEKLDFAAFIKDFSEIKIVEYWISKDVRPGRREEKWLNLILQKSDIV